NLVNSEQIDIKKLWDDVLVSIELAITPANFKTWFRDTRIVSLEDGTVILGVPSVFVKDWLQDKFQPMILRVLRENAPFIRNIEYTVVQRNDKKPENRTANNINSALPLEEYYINKSDNLNPRYSF